MTPFPPPSRPEIFDAVWACALLLLRQQTLAVDGSMAADGSVLLRYFDEDAKRYRTRVGCRNADAFEAARVFVRHVGAAKAMKSARVRAALPTKGRVEWL